MSDTRGMQDANMIVAHMLKPFFPRTMRSGKIERQARDYIRRSALGRGAVPRGAPPVTDMLRIMHAAGFTGGGRGSDHIYAPWSRLSQGWGDDANAFRRECASFVDDATKVPERLARMVVETQSRMR